MTGVNKQYSIWAASMVASLAAAFAAVGASQAASDRLSCEIAAHPSGGMTAIEGLAHAGESLSGSYRLTISGGGSNIRQGGAFDASAGETVTLGSATLGGSSGGYDVELELTTNGDTVRCDERVGGRP